MRILIIGGHMTPALAVIDALPKGTEIIYVGRKHALEGDTALSLEYQTVQQRGITFVEIQTGRLQRKFTRHTVPSLVRLSKGMLAAQRIIRTYKPDVVVGFGGYVSVPIGIAAVFQRIPVIIHEQTLRAGLANKLLAPFVRKVCISWPPSQKFFPSYKTVLTGNPILQFPSSCSCLYSQKSYPLPVVLVIGGSLGSHALNIMIEKNLASLVKKYMVIHQTGDAHEFGDFARLEKEQKLLPQQLQKNYQPIKFIDPAHIACAIKQADIVVARTGINTVTLLMLLQKKCILVPLPIGQKDEQLTNARFLAKHTPSIILDQNSIKPQEILVAIDTLATTKTTDNPIDEHLRQVILHSAERIVEVVSSSRNS